METLNSLLSADWFTPVNKELSKQLWFLTAWFLWELIRQRKRFWQEEFYFRQKDMEEEIWFSPYQQRECIKKLKKHWLIETEIKWIPAKTWYQINDEQVIEIFENKKSKNLTSGSKKTWEQEVEKLDNTSNKNESKNNNKNENNILSEDNTTEVEDYYSTKQTKEKKQYGNSEINEMIEMFKDVNWGIVDWTQKQQRQYWKLLLDKLKNLDAVQEWKYSWQSVLDILLKKISQNPYHATKISGPQKTYYHLTELMNVVRWEMQKTEKKKSTVINLDD